MITKREFAQWLRERDEAISSLDICTFKEFYSKWKEKGVYQRSLPNSDTVVELAVYQMAVDIPKIPQEIKDKALKWLKEHDYKPIDWGE